MLWLQVCVKVIGKTEKISSSGNVSQMSSMWWACELLYACDLGSGVKWLYRKLYVLCVCVCLCCTQPLIWPLSQWQVENGSAVCHHSWIIHSQQCSMEWELRCAYCHAELHGLVITLSGPGTRRFVCFKLVSVHSQLISFRPSSANNLLNTILILFMDLSQDKYHNTNLQWQPPSHLPLAENK